MKVKHTILRYHLLLLLASLAIVPAGCTTGPASTPTSIDIEDAIDQGLVVPHFHGCGSSSGDCIEVKFDVDVDFDIELIVPPGTILTPGDHAQSMVLMDLKGIITGPTTFRTVSNITLKPETHISETYLFEAYCMNFHKSNPSKSTTFSVEGTADERVQAILDCGRQSNASIGAIQTAIWAVTDDVSRSELLSRFPVTSSEMEKARGLLTCAGVNLDTTRLFRLN